MVVNGGAVHEEPLLENGKAPNKPGEKVPLLQRLKVRIRDLCTLTVPRAQAAGYFLMALLGSVILVLAPGASFFSVRASHTLAQLARPGYNCTLDWIGQELEALIEVVPIYVVMPLFVCACAFHAFIVLSAAWVLLRCCHLKITSLPQTPPAFRSCLVIWTLITHFRRIGLFFTFLVITVVAVYPLIWLGVPCLSGIMIAQMFAYALFGCWNILLNRQYCVIMRLPDKDVSARTMDKKELNRRFNRAGIPGF